MKISERAIRAMPYDVRLQHYEKEKKEQLFYMLKDSTTAQREEACKELARKWRV